MTQSTTTNDSQNKATSNESEADKQQRAAGVNPDKSSHDNKSNEKAGSDEGAGGGAKQQQGK